MTNYLLFCIFIMGFCIWSKLHMIVRELRRVNDREEGKDENRSDRS